MEEMAEKASIFPFAGELIFFTTVLLRHSHFEFSEMFAVPEFRNKQSP
jgi:phosphoribosyl-ATP pyrophosphohydrolase